MIEPIAWIDTNTKKLALSHRDLADFERFVKIEPLYSKDTIDKICMQVAKEVAYVYCDEPQAVFIVDLRHIIDKVLYECIQ